ncbi:H-NS histone family protein, partial [Burkholderia mallei FMH]
MRCHPLATTVPTSRSVEPFISLWFVWPFFKADETRRNPLCGSPEFRASRVRMTATAPRRASPAGWLQCRPQCRPKRRRAKRAAGIGRIRGARTISGRKRVPGILPECALPQSDCAATTSIARTSRDPENGPARSAMRIARRRKFDVRSHDILENFLLPAILTPMLDWIKGENMSTYLELKAKADEILRQAEEARRSELETVLKEVRTRVAEYGLTPEQVSARA